MREIRQSGSEGGAVQSRPYPYHPGELPCKIKLTKL